MNNIHNNRVGYKSFFSYYLKGVLPAFLIAFVFSIGLFLTSCSDPNAPIEDNNIYRVEESRNSTNEHYTLSTFRKSAGNSEVINLNESVKFNDNAKYQIQIKDFKTNQWINLEIDIQDGDVSHLKPKKKYQEYDVYTPKSSISIKDFYKFKYIEIVASSNFKNENNEFEVRILESTNTDLSNNSTNSNTIIENVNILEVERFTNLSEVKAKIQTKEFQ